MRVPFVILTAITLSLPALAQAPDQPRAKTRTLRGQVLDARLQPMAKAEVRTGTAEEFDRATPPVPVATTDATGTFSITVPTGALPLVRVSAPGATTAMWGLNDHVSFPVEWAGGFQQHFPSDHLPALVLEPARPVQGRVRDQQGKPVASALIETEDLLAGWTGNAPWQLRDATRTDQGGIFVLRGTPAQALRLRVSAPGFYTRSLAPIDAGSPLDLSLVPSGFLAGTVVDAAGKPVAAQVTVVYEGYPQELLETAADGAFRTTWRHPAHCQVMAAACSAAAEAAPTAASGWIPPPPVPSGQSETITAPREDLRISVTLPAPTATALRVQAVDEQGKPIADFRAGVSWNGSEQPDAIVLHYLATQGAAAADGTAALPSPQGVDEEQSGIVAVSSPGRATTLRKVTWEPASEGANVDVKVTLTPGFTVQGTVQEHDGKPAVAALVWATGGQRAQGWDPGVDGEQGAVRTGADGTFRIDTLGEGTWYFHSKAGPGSPVATPRRVKVGKEPVAALTLKLPRLVDVKGRVDGAVPPGSMLTLIESKGGEDGGRTVPLDAEGRFQVKGLLEGSKGFTLLVPRSPRSGGQLALACTAVRVTADNTDITVVPRERIGRVQGRVKCGEMRVPPERLMVCARARTDTQVYQRAPEICTAVHPDGTFELSVPTNARLLCVRDALTGMTLGEDVECNVDGDKVKPVDLVIDVGEVRVRLQSADAGEEGPGVRLHLRVAGQEDERWWMFANQSSGLDLCDTASEVTLYLKAGQTSFRLQRGSLGWEKGQGVFFGGETEGEELEALDVRPGKQHDVTLKIPRRQALGR